MDEKVKSRFLALYCMMLADGIITWEELTKLYEIGHNNYDLTDEQINKTVSEVGNSFTLPDTLEGKVELLYHLSEIAWADGKFDETERTLITKYARIMGFVDTNIKDIVDYISNQVQNKKSLKETLNEINS